MLAVLSLTLVAVGVLASLAGLGLELRARRLRRDAGEPSSPVLLLLLALTAVGLGGVLVSRLV